MTAKRQAVTLKLREIHNNTGATMKTRRTRDTRHSPGTLADRVREKQSPDIVPIGALKLARKYGGEVSVYRVTFAGPDAELAAHTFQAWSDQFPEALGDPDLFCTHIRDATFIDSYGAGAWGVEGGVTLETATPMAQDVVTLVVAYLRAWSQDCAYVTVNGQDAYEIASDGTVTPIKG